jgi:A/G-specific adenine glycosylase
MPLPAAKKTIREMQARLTPPTRAGDYAQAMMDLGAAICTPKRPSCSLCPLSEPCAARAAGRQEDYPVKADRAKRPTRYGAAFVAVRADGAILLRRRADQGLLGGMTEVPGTEWSEKTETSLDAAPLAAAWKRLSGDVTHVFTHFRLELSIYRADIGMRRKPPAGSWWASPQSLPDEALPSVMRKAIEAALPGAARKRAA